MSGVDARRVAFDDMPLRRFHLLIATAGTVGQFSDGYILGIIGIAVVGAASDLSLSPAWEGLLGAGSLVGLFVGSLFTGMIADRLGRRNVFAFDMALFAVLSVLQFWVDTGWQLLVLRLALGLVLGADYVVSKSLVVEFVPRRSRGRMLSLLGVAWSAGYVVAYFVGFLLRDAGVDPWRWMLVTSALPAALILVPRMLVPESPRWLVGQGSVDEARRVVSTRFGDDVELPVVAPTPEKAAHPWRQLLSPRLRVNTITGCLFYTCQVIPYFALSTFAPRVLEELGVEGSYAGGVVYNVFVLSGALVGMLVIDRIGRRSMLVGGFLASALVLLPLVVTQALPGWLVVALFAAFALVLVASANLEYVYPQELFPTEVRASGVGVAVAASRLGSATSTFLLPVVVASAGIRWALGACLLVLLVGAMGSWRWAPETGGRDLAEARGAGVPRPSPASGGRGGRD